MKFFEINIDTIPLQFFPIHNTDSSPMLFNVFLPPHHKQLAIVIVSATHQYHSPTDKFSDINIDGMLLTPLRGTRIIPDCPENDELMLIDQDRSCRNFYAELCMVRRHTTLRY